MDDPRKEEQRGLSAGGVPPGVEERLCALRVLYVAERDGDARDRLERERPQIQRAFADLVGDRLRELRALQDLAAHLHSAQASVSLSGCPRTPGESQDR